MGCELAEAGSAWLWDKGLQGSWEQWRVSPLHLPYSWDCRQCGTVPKLSEFCFPHLVELIVLGLVDAASTELDSRELGSLCQITRNSGDECDAAALSAANSQVSQVCFVCELPQSGTKYPWLPAAQSAPGLLPAYPSATSWDMQPERGCGAGRCGVALSGRWILLQALKSRHQAVGLDWPPHCTTALLGALPQPRLSHIPLTLALQLGSVPLCPSLEYPVDAEPCPWGSGQPSPHMAFISVLPVSHKGWLHPRANDVEALRSLSIGKEGLVSPTRGMQDGAGAQAEHGGHGKSNRSTQAGSGLAACNTHGRMKPACPGAPQADAAGDAVCVCFL